MPDLSGELAAVPMLAGLDDAMLALLAASAFVRTVGRGQLLFSEGEPSDYLYLVRSGRLRVYVSSPRGEELVLSVVGPGDSLGELSILDRQPRSASVDALERTVVVAVAADEVRRLIERSPAALHAVALALAAGMRRLSGTAADLVFLDLPRRLAKLLLADATTAPDGTVTSELGMSQSGVAARLGVTRQSLNKGLVGLAQRGWISVDGTHVRLHDGPALRRFADS